jgi:hypothetical protein
VYTCSDGPVVAHAVYPLIFNSNTNEVWCFDDGFPEIFTLPPNLLAPVAVGNLGSWRAWPGTGRPVYSTGGLPSMALMGSVIYIFGGGSRPNR